MNSSSNWRRRVERVAGLLRRAANSLRSPAKLLARNPRVTESRSRTSAALKIAGYSLVLMDPDGQVIWTGEWDSGGVFEFGKRQRLWVICGFTNRSQQETEVSEYEIELMGEDGSVVERFNDSFGDSLVIPPGESKHFTAEWKM